MHPPAEADLAVYLDDRNAVVEAGPMLGMGVDIDRVHRESMRLQDLAGMLAEVAALSRVEDGTFWSSGSRHGRG